MAEDISDLQWVPPPIETWNLTNSCSSYARFASTILRRSEHETVDLCAVDVYALHEYVASSLPSTSQKSEANFTSQHTAIWYLSVCEWPANGTWSSQCYGVHYCQTAYKFQNNVSSMIYEAEVGEGACLKELRSSLDVEGNADMAGIGVSRVIPSPL